MTRSFAAAVVAAMACTACAGSNHTPTQETPSLDSVVSSETGFSGHILVVEGDEIVFDHVSGEAEPGRAMTQSEHWRWASVTKQLVAVAIMDAVDDGALRLDSTVSEILPDLAGPDTGAVQIKHLLQHTSGLLNPYGLSQEDLALQMSFGLSPAALCLQTATSPAGAEFSYNNCDFIVLGAVLEAVDGGTWLESLSVRVFEPAAMTDVYFNSPDQVETVADPAPTSAVAPIAQYGAAGGLYGTPQSLVAFNSALLDGRLLSDEARAALWDGNPKLGFVALGQWSFSAPLAGCSETVAIVERRGEIGGIQARNILLPEVDLSVIVFTNSPGLDFGEIWMGQGFAHDLLSAAACTN